MIIGIITVVLVLWESFKHHLNVQICLTRKVSKRSKRWAGYILGICFFLGIIIFVLVDSLTTSPPKSQNLLGLGGLVFYTVISIILSDNPDRIIWRPVLWGFALQFIIAVLVLRTHFGYTAFNYVGTQVATFLEFAAGGAEFVFGPELVKTFAFGVAPIIVYMSMITSMLYYTGLMGYLIEKVAWLFQRSCATTGPESMVVIGNIFLSMTESPLLVKVKGFRT